MVEALRRKRTTLAAEAQALAAEGQEAFRMAGVVRRRQERAAGSGERFAFVSLSDPTGEYEVLFPPEALRSCREVLEPGRCVVLRVRAKSANGEVRFFGDAAEPLEKATENAVAGLRIYLSAQTADLVALQRRLDGARAPRGGELTLVAALEGAREIELKLPGKYALDAAFRGAVKTAPGVVMLEDV
jgi:DNA polymerase III subunit alpha